MSRRHETSSHDFLGHKEFLFGPLASTIKSLAYQYRKANPIPHVIYAPDSFGFAVWHWQRVKRPWPVGCAGVFI
jgi:hypothetical protein